MQAQKIIIIHPGSLYLRIGRASDLNPVTILHAIGRKRRQPNEGTAYHDPLLPRVHSTVAINEFEEQRLHVSRAIQSYVPSHVALQRGNKRLRVATPPQQIASFNKRSMPEELSDIESEKEESNNIKLENGAAGDNDVARNGKSKNTGSEIIFDREILRLRPAEAAAYNVHFPMRRGELNLHSDIGGSKTSVLNDLETIWLHALQLHLGISAAALPHYNAVLVISDVYRIGHLREQVQLLLQRLRFRSCFLLQDHVAATFGAGLSYACVVDIGDQKSSISCVEDGISHPNTRVRLGYGGGDLTQVFHTLLLKCSFPYRECDIAAGYADAALIMQLKEHFCHLNLDISGAREEMFEVRKHNKRLRYTIQLGDECVVAPLAIFHSELLNLTGKEKQICTQLSGVQQVDPEDCFDAEYIRETGRRNARDQMPITGDGAFIGPGNTSAAVVAAATAVADDDLVVDDMVAAERDMMNAKNNSCDDKDEHDEYQLPNGQIVSLDLAIVRSIERCSSDEMKRKMFGCILLVGGSVKFPGFAKWLEQKLSAVVMSTYQNRLNEQQQLQPSTLMPLQPNQFAFDVNVITKEMDAGMIAWKGAAIMSCLESAPELWIYGSEWEKHGLRVLREKAPFIW